MFDHQLPSLRQRLDPAPPERGRLRLEICLQYHLDLVSCHEVLPVRVMLQVSKQPVIGRYLVRTIRWMWYDCPAIGRELHLHLSCHMGVRAVRLKMDSMVL